MHSTPALPARKDVHITRSGRSTSDISNMEELVPGDDAPINPVATALEHEAEMPLYQRQKGAPDQPDPQVAADPVALYEQVDGPQDDAVAERDRLRAAMQRVRKPSWVAKLLGFFGIGSRTRIEFVEGKTDETHRMVSELHRQIEYRARFEGAVEHNQRVRNELIASQTEALRVQGLLDERNELLGRIFRTNRLLSIKAAYASLLDEGQSANIEERLGNLELAQAQLENAIRSQHGFDTEILPSDVQDVNPASFDLPDNAPVFEVDSSVAMGYTEETLAGVEDEVPPLSPATAKTISDIVAHTTPLKEEESLTVGKP